MANASSEPSSVKRGIQRKLEMARRNDDLRRNLPVYTKDEIRKYRLPYHQAVIEELLESGYPNSAEYISMLLAHQDKYRKQHIYDVIILSRPLLIESNHELDRLAEALKEAETAHVTNNTGSEIDALLKLTVHYAFGTADWWWLADLLFSQCVKISSLYTDDEGFRDAECSYIYGKYLIVQDVDEETGLENLNVARELSEGKLWNASKIMQVLEQSIFTESCSLIYRTLVKQVEDLLIPEPLQAVRLFMRAKKRGIEACLPKADILLLQGRCEMEVSRPNVAAECFRKAYFLFRNENQIEKSCETRIFLAVAYLQMGKWERSNSELQDLLKFAQKNKLLNYVGLAHLYTGQYYLNQGTPENATPSLVQAFNIFHELNDVANRELVENLACVSKGQELFSKYSDLILRCETKDPAQRARNLGRLIQWKDIRTSFCEDMSESIHSDLQDDSATDDSLNSSEFLKYCKEMEDGDAEGGYEEEQIVDELCGDVIAQETLKLI